MKRWIILALVLALVLSVMVVPAFAAGRRGSFVDADKDGVCDNYAANDCRMQAGCRMAQGANYADADNDGVCDNMADFGGKGCCRRAGR